MTDVAEAFPGITYSATYKSWYTDDTEETLKQILLVFSDKADIDISAIVKKSEETKLKPTRPELEACCQSF